MKQQCRLGWLEAVHLHQYNGRHTTLTSLKAGMLQCKARLAIGGGCGSPVTTPPYHNCQIESTLGSDSLRSVQSVSGRFRSFGVQVSFWRRNTLTFCCCCFNCAAAFAKPPATQASTVASPNCHAADRTEQSGWFRV